MSNHLCEELIVEIFSRLPTKSLLRFRSVSKSLYDLIGSPGFIRLQTLRAPKRFAITHQQVRYQGDARSRKMYTLHSEEQLSSYAGITPNEYPFGDSSHIVGSCNGILCLYECEINAAFHLWNPSIRRKVTVYAPPSLPLGFLASGFFFDPIMDDYKILRINGTRTLVYTMKTRTWREIASVAPSIAFLNSYQSFPCLFDGESHWVAAWDLGHGAYYYCILRFDLSSEVFSTIELPEACRETTRHVTIIKGCLAVMCSERYGHDSWIWVRNTAAASWSFAFKVDTPQPWRSAHGDLFFSRYYRGILVYNPETKVQSRVVHLTDSYIREMITFTESLGLLDVGTSCDVIKGSRLSKRSRRVE